LLQQRRAPYASYFLLRYAIRLAYYATLFTPLPAFDADDAFSDIFLLARGYAMLILRLFSRFDADAAIFCLRFSAAIFR